MSDNQGKSELELKTKRIEPAEKKTPQVEKRKECTRQEFKRRESKPK